MRSLIVLASLAIAACSAVPGASTPGLSNPDLWIAGGMIVDGSGAPARRADVFVVDDRISWVGLPAADARIDAKRRIDASGMVVAPGFIDSHAHGSPLIDGAFENFLAMGVTTICLGQDGASPTRGALAPWMQAVRDQSLGPNVMTLAGHGTARHTAGVGFAAQPTATQIDAIASAIEADLAAGAFGLSTGLEYEPGTFANPKELDAVARPVAKAGGILMSHVRSEDDGQLEAAIEELLEQCRTAGCSPHVSHLKIVYAEGAERAREVLALLESARRDGLRVTADVYPYVASYTGIGIVFPDWAKPPNDFATAVATRRDELRDYLRRRVTLRNGAAATVLGTGEWAGLTLEEVADLLGKPFEDVLIDDLGPAGASAAYFVMNHDVMSTLLTAPWVVVASDGSPMMRHPRGYGTFARVIRDFVVERKLLTLPEAVHKMSGLSAEILGLEDRGSIRVGNFADLVVFDPDRVRDVATFEDPYQLADGFRDVIVNGEAVRRDGAFTGVMSGRLLMR